MSKFWRHFVSNGRASFVERHLGLFGTGVDLPAAALVRLGLEQARGIKVRSVEPEGPADHAGMQRGDILVLLAEKPVSSLSGLYQLLRRLPVGLPLVVRVLRDDRLLERWIILNDHPNPARRQ